MKTTVFNKIHKEMGGQMVEFAGFEMPLKYSGINEEHINVRKNVGVFDVSHMGELWIKGPKAFDLVQRVTTNDVGKLTPGKVQYSCMPNGKGGIVDDLLVYHYEDEKYLLVVNASNIDKDLAWIKQQNENIGAEIENGSEHTSQLAVQGPAATKVLQKLTDVNLNEITYYTFVTGKIAGIDEVIISATGYTGSGGFELYVYNKDAEKLWNAIFEAGKEFNIMPAGLAARDTLRLEAGYVLYGNDIDDTTSPIEAGLGWITKFTENNQFIDREKLEKIKAEKPAQRLCGFVLQERGIPRKGYEILDENGNLIGHVTSGTMSPMLKQGIGMGYVKTGLHKTDTEIIIKTKNKSLKAKVVKLPFVKL